VLTLVLKRMREGKLKLSKIGRAPLLSIDEGVEASPPAPTLDNVALSRTPSLDSLSTHSSQWVLASVSGESNQEVAPLLEKHTSLPKQDLVVDRPPDVPLAVSAPADMRTQQCLLEDAVVLLEDGSVGGVKDRKKNSRLLSMRSGGASLGVCVCRCTTDRSALHAETRPGRGRHQPYWLFHGHRAE